MTTSTRPHHLARLRRITAARRHDDRGAVAAELALSFPLAALFLFLIIGTFHLGAATVDVNSAASAAARAASIAHTGATADTAARDMATTNLAGRCHTVTVTVDTSQFHRGGQVTVRVACTVTTHGLIGVGLPGSMTVSATSTSPLDLYRTTS